MSTLRKIIAINMIIQVFTGIFIFIFYLIGLFFEQTISISIALILIIFFAIHSLFVMLLVKIDKCS